MRGRLQVGWVVGCGLALLGCRGTSARVQHRLEGATVGLPGAFALKSGPFGLPRLLEVGGRLGAQPAQRFAYRFTRGSYREFLMLGGSYGVNPVILDVQFFRRDFPANQLASRRACITSEVWGYGDCSTGDEDDKPAEAAGEQDGASVVVSEGALTVYRSPHPAADWQDARAPKTLGFAAVDVDKRLRLDLYVSRDRYSADEAVELLINVARSFEAEPSALEDAFARADAALEKERAASQGFLDVMGAALGEVGGALGPMGRYTVQSGVVSMVGRLSTSGFEDLFVALPFGTLQFPPGTVFGRGGPPLEVLGDSARFPAPPPSPGEGEDTGFSAAYFNAEDDRWATADVYSPTSPEHYSQELHGLNELSKGWDRATVFLYRRLQGRYPHPKDPAALRVLLGEYIRGVKQMQAEQRAGALIRVRPTGR